MTATIKELATIAHAQRNEIFVAVTDCGKNHEKYQDEINLAVFLMSVEDIEQILAKTYADLHSDGLTDEEIWLFALGDAAQAAVNPKLEYHISEHTAVRATK